MSLSLSVQCQHRPDQDVLLPRGGDTQNRMRERLQEASRVHWDPRPSWFGLPFRREMSPHFPFVMGLVHLRYVFKLSLSSADAVFPLPGHFPLRPSQQVCAKNAHDDIFLPVGFFRSPLPIMSYFPERGSRRGVCGAPCPVVAARVGAGRGPQLCGSSWNEARAWSSGVLRWKPNKTQFCV